MTKKRTLFAILGVLLLFSLGYFLDTLRMGGQFLDIEPHQPGPCVEIEGIVGGEDLQWRPNGKEIFVSAQNRRSLDEEGHIYLVDPREKSVEDVTPELDFSFHPHGLHLFVDDDGSERLFVVNHRGGWSPPSTVEIFDVNPDGTLIYRRTIESEALNSPNDLVAVGPDQFYVTNDHGATSDLGQTFETLLRIPLGNLSFFDGSDFQVVHRRTKYANGVNISHDGTELYLAETLRQTVKVFDRDLSTNALELTEVISLKSGVDNIDVAPDGSLWIGSHPKLLAFMAHASDPETPSPSQVIRVYQDEDESWQQVEIYLDDGGPISGSSAAAIWNNTMVIGPVFDTHILVCDLN